MVKKALISIQKLKFSAKTVHKNSCNHSGLWRTFEIAKILEIVINQKKEEKWRKLKAVAMTTATTAAAAAAGRVKEEKINKKMCVCLSVCVCVCVYI